MTRLEICFAGDDRLQEFDVLDGTAENIAGLLSDPDAVLSCGDHLVDVYVPVRHIAYVRVRRT
jgi:hypothetical protein